MIIERRKFLLLVASAALSSTLAYPAFAKDGGDGGGHDGGGHDDGGHDDGGHDDRGHDDDGGDDHGRRGRRDDDDLSQDEALNELRLGRVISLKTALSIANAKVRGKVIDVNLATNFGRPQYRVKIRRANGTITIIRLDARTGRFIGFLGF